jgi:hypothetical protein
MRLTSVGFDSPSESPGFNRSQIAVIFASLNEVTERLFECAVRLVTEEATVIGI